MTQTVEHWIGGKPFSAAGTRTGLIHDPATGAATAEVTFADGSTVNRAVAEAVEAFRSWHSSSLSTRSRVMFAFRELLNDHRDELAQLITNEHGKVLSDAAGEVQRGIEVVEFACGIPQLLKGGFSENVSTAVDSYDLAQPLGVVAGITPFNFPAMVPMWMFPVAIACGNSFVLKPSEKDPSVSIRIAELLAEAGLPEGVFNVVHGDKEAVDALLTHPDVAAVSFVGSTPVARYVFRTATEHGKRVQSLGGAKNHLIVLPDADVDHTADAIVSAGYGSAGERCMSVSAVVAVGEIADPLVAAVAEKAKALRVGPGTNPHSEMGPLVTADHRDRVARYVDTGLAEGAHLATDGRSLQVEGHEDGYWLGPCLFDHVTPDMTIYRDEIFGPVLSVLRTEDLDAAIDLVNRNPYGNGVALFTNSGGAARRFRHQVEVGMVGINVPIPVPMAYYSFGGWKDSLFGDSHMHGTEGVRFYTRRKAVTVRWPNPSVDPSGPDLRMPSSHHGG